MSDRATVLLAALAWLGAAVGLRLGVGPPVVAASLVVLAAIVLRRPPLLLVVIALLTSARAVADTRDLATLDVGPVHEWATLVTDPEPRSDDRVRVEVRARGRHLLATAKGEAAATLAQRAAGERVLVSGRATRAPPGSDWLARRHIAGQLTIDGIEDVDRGALITRWANGLRAVLARSAEALPEDQRGLYLGFVLGDDRQQSPAIVDDFRGAGLSHVLVVSGQNVAFMITLASPLLRRLGLRWRWTATLAIIGLFAWIARFEPSVLRASVMAGLAATAFMVGREASGLRLLALAVTALLVVDPFLVDSVGFQLSVAASASIVVLSPLLARRIPGPRAIADAFAVSAAAQVGVAPILIATFGGAPVAGLVANVLAAPATGPVMIWGFAAGIVGGVLGPLVGTVLHVPTRVFIAWVALVAERAARWPFGQLGGREFAAVLAGGVCVCVPRFARRTWLRVTGGVVATLGLLAPALTRSRAPEESAVQIGDAALWRAGGAAVLVAGPGSTPATLLEGLRAAGVDRLDALVLTAPGDDDLVATVGSRITVHAVVRASDVTAPTALQFGALEVVVEPSSSHPVVVVREVDRARGARDPPV